MKNRFITICPQCGKEILSDSIYCEYCGAKVKQETTPSINVNETEKSSTHQTVGAFWGKLKIWKKILIGVLLLSILYFFVKLCLNPYSTLFCILYIISALIFLLGIYQKSKLDSQSFSVREPNGKSPSTLGLFCGIGHALTGAFKYRQVDDTYVSYTFFFVLLPLFPTGCYRVKLLESNGAASFNSQRWEIYGEEDMNKSEILNVYLLFYGALLSVLSLIFAILI